MKKSLLALLLAVALVSPVFAVKPKPKPVVKKQPIHAVKKDVKPLPKEAVKQEPKPLNQREVIEIERETEFVVEHPISPERK